MYRKKTEGWLKHWDFFLLDVVVLQAAFFLSEFFVLRFRNFNYHDIYRTEALLLFLCIVIHVFLSEPYSGIRKRDFAKEVQKVFYQTVYMAVTDIVFLYFIHAASYLSRNVQIWTWILYVILILPLRTLLKMFLNSRKQPQGRRSCLILTQRAYLDWILQLIREENADPDAVTGIFLEDPDGSGQEIFSEGADGEIVYGQLEDSLKYAQYHWVDEIFVYLPDQGQLGRKLNREFLNMGITVHQLLETEEEEEISDNAVIERRGSGIYFTQSVRLITFPEQVLKRTSDILGGIVGCILTGVLFLFVAPAIWVQSPGPVFFSQIRIGQNGRPFRIYKFRSMYLDAENRKAELTERNMSRDGLLFKVENDPRIIGSGKVRRDGSPRGIGYFIRKTSIDEFPQFWNVLKGDMSLVGTRPPTQDEWEKYAPYHRARLSVRPGITGMWQVSGRNEVMDFEEVVKLDMKYIRNWSLLLDLRILLRTVHVLFSGKGAL